MRLVYLDESGGVTPFHGSRFLVVALICADQSAMRAIELHIKRLRRATAEKTTGEIKAANATMAQRLSFLRALAEEDVAIIAIIIDKAGVVREPEDAEEWYRLAVVRSIEHCLSRWSDVEIVLDKRYTKRVLRDKLEAAIREKAGDKIKISQLESSAVLGLQAVDFVAWAIHRKYEWSDSVYYEIIQDRIVAEQVIQP